MFEITMGIMLSLAEVQYNDIPSLNHAPGSIRQLLVKAGPAALPFLNVRVHMGGNRADSVKEVINDLEYWPKVEEQLELLESFRFHERKMAVAELQSMIDSNPNVGDFIVEALEETKSLDKRHHLSKLRDYWYENRSRR